MANIRTVAKSGGDHTSIGAAMSWMQSNHDFDTDGIATIEIQDAEEYNENVSITGISGTTSSTAYLHLTVASGARGLGIPGDGARIRGSSGGSHCITVNEDWTFIDHLEIQQDSGGGSDEGIRISSGIDDVTISRCVVWSDTTTSDSDGIYAGNYSCSAYIDNCLLFGWHRGAIHAQNYNGTSDQTWTIDHCTIYDSGNDAVSDSGGIVANSASSGTNDITVYNTASLDSNPGGADDWQEFSGSSTWAGTHNADSDGSLSDISLTTSAEQNLTVSDSSQTSGDYFVVVETASGSEDFNLLDSEAGNKAYENGTDRTGSEPDSVRQDFSTDIAGYTRKATPDIGAFELVESTPDATVELSGQEVTAEKNDPSVVIDHTITLTGQATTAQFEDGITVTIGADVTLTGQEVAVEKNDPSVTIDHTIELTGNEVTAEKNDPSVVIGTVVELSGQAVTAEFEDDVSITISDTATLTGQAVTVEFEDDLTIDTDEPDATIELSGQEVTSQKTDPTVTISHAITLTGQAVTAQFEDDISITIGADVALTGQGVTAEKNDPSITIGETVTLTGQKVTAERGSPTAETDTIVTLIGQAVTAQFEDDLSFTFSTTATLTGQEVETQRGNISVSADTVSIVGKTLTEWIWLQGGLTATQTNDRWMEYLEQEGYTEGSIDDRFYAWWDAQGYEDSITDKRAAWQEVNLA